jgi:predicted O-methyltransferase YrrM
MLEASMTEPRQLPPSWQPPLCDDRPLWDIWMATCHMPALTAADELGLFARLKDQPASDRELSRDLGIGLRAVRALAGLLAALGLLVRRDGRFYLSPVARQYLLPDGPLYWGGILHPFREFTPTHTMVLAALRDDQQAEFDVGGHRMTDGLPGAWQAPAPDPAQLAWLTRFMHSHAMPAAYGLAQAVDLRDARRLLDVGGGSGAISIALTMRNTHLRSTLLDLAPVCEIAAEHVASYALAERIRVLPADMFVDRWPDGHDIVLMADVLHDWDRPRCQALLQRAYLALPPGGRVLIHEVLLDDSRNAPPAAAAYSLHMVYTTKGAQFTLGDLTELLADAGFVDVTARPTFGYFSVVTATRP